MRKEMMVNSKKSVVLMAIAIFIVSFISPFMAQGQTSRDSIYTQKVNDSRAVYLTKDDFNVSADGRGDDAPAIQAAIDMVRGGGIVFIPEGTYRLGETVYIWRAIRLIGYGKKRPVFKLGDNTPGYQNGDHKYMVHFCQAPPGSKGSLQPNTWVTDKFQDGTYTTFYSGLQNIDFEIGKGNPAAIAVRQRVAQVCVFDHVHFNIGTGRGGIQQAGNIIEHCSFQGGEFAIKTKTSAPSWQITVLNCSFEEQREVSINTIDAKMLVIRGRFKNTPVAIDLPEPDQLFVKDTWFENIQNCAVRTKNYVDEDLQVNLENLKFSNVPYSIRFKTKIHQAGRKGAKMDYEAPAPIYMIKELSQGVHIENLQGSAVHRSFGVQIDQQPIESLGEFPRDDMAPLPAQETWVNITDLGAIGDGTTDCTDIFKAAIAKHDTIYLPMGRYVISDTLHLREKTTLVGLHPNRTQLALKSGTEAFMDAENLKALVVAPAGGSNGLTGIGVGVGNHAGAIGIKWMAGVHSYVNDGHFRSRGKHAGSLWVVNGGGGTFKNMWIEGGGAPEPFYISNTVTPGNIYEISVEHHKIVEVKIDNVENWSFYGLQLEENIGSEKTLGMSISNSKNIMLANFRSHRTSGVWEPYLMGIQLRNVEEFTMKGACYTGFVFPYDHSVFDISTGAAIPNLKFTKLYIK